MMLRQQLVVTYQALRAYLRVKTHTGVLQGRGRMAPPGGVEPTRRMLENHTYMSI